MSCVTIQRTVESRSPSRGADGDPIANIKLIEDPAKNFVVIAKDGKIFKNTLLGAPFFHVGSALIRTPSLLLSCRG